MKKTFLLVLCLMLLAAQFARAEEAPRAESAVLESALLRDGLELRSETSFAWGGLPMLDSEQNNALESLLSVAKTVVRRQGIEGNGYTALDLHLQKVSVLDIAMQAKEGVYIESSNLIGGQTVAFTKSEFSSFARRISQRSEGVLLSNLGLVYDLTMLSLGGPETPVVDMESLNHFLSEVEEWGGDALVTEERLRPQVLLPGVYGTRAVVTEITREEALSLAGRMEALLKDTEMDAVWAGALLDSFPEEGEDTAKARLSDIKALITELSGALAEALPEDMPPAEYREIYGLGDQLVSRQLELQMPGSLVLTLEWALSGEVLTDLYVSAVLMGSGFSVLYTRELGAPVATGKVTQRQDRHIAQVRAFMDGLALNAVITRQENVELRANKEITTVKTEVMLESEPLLGKDTVVTLSIQALSTASGEGIDYKRSVDRSFYLKGLGFDGQKILTVSTVTTAEEPSSPIDPGAPLIRPSSFSDEALDEWIKGVQVSFVQAGYTVLGRVPPAVAMYLLDHVIEQ